MQENSLEQADPTGVNYARRPPPANNKKQSPVPKQETVTVNGSAANVASTARVITDTSASSKSDKSFNPDSSSNIFDFKKGTSTK